MEPEKNLRKQLIDNLKKERRSDIRKRTVLSVIGIVTFFGIWQLLSILELGRSDIIASPVEILKMIIYKLSNKVPDGNTLQFNIASSFILAVIGFVLGSVIGVPLGLLMGWYKPIFKIVSPVFELIRPIPPIAWIPLTIILLGIGLVPKGVIIFFAAFVPIVINSYTGIKSTNIVYINFAKTCGASKWAIFLKVGIPSAMPLTFAGLRIALGNSWSTLIAAEMLASSAGLGYMIMMGRQLGKIDLILVGMVVIGIVGVLLSGVLNLVERRCLRWRIDK